MGNEPYRPSRRDTFIGYAVMGAYAAGIRNPNDVADAAIKTTDRLLELIDRPPVVKPERKAVPAQEPGHALRRPDLETTGGILPSKIAG